MVLTVTLLEGPRQENELRVYQDVVLEFRYRDISYLDRVRRRWSKEEAGALVSQVDAGGWAAVGGLRPDDLIASVDGKLVRSAQELEALLRPVKDEKPHHLTFFVKRGVQTLFLELQPTWGDIREASK